MTGFPSIYLFKKMDKLSPIKFTDENDYEHIISFLNEHLQLDYTTVEGTDNEVVAGIDNDEL